MKLSEVKQLLKANGYQYKVTVIPSRDEFYRQKGFCPTADADAFLLVIIDNPNHEKDIQIVFDGDLDNAEFYDLEFGGYYYEMFDCLDEELPQILINAIYNIIAGKSYVIFAANAKTGCLYYDGLFCNDHEKAQNDMDKFINHLDSFDICYVHELFEHRWGQRVVRFYDPDKHIIKVGEKLDAVILRFIELGLSAEETAARMDLPLDFVRSVYVDDNELHLSKHIKKQMNFNFIEC